jgi:8-oxo-dGTP pyrophosphatase MutT (NUDIX family)
MSEWKVLSSEEVHLAGFFRLRRDRCELPDGRVMPRYYVVEFPDWVNVVPITKDGQVVMVEQYRHGAGETFLEIPGGMTHSPKEDHLSGGRRELAEETGYEANEWIYCGHQFPNPALQNNKLHTYLALDCEFAGKQHLDPFEDLKVKLMPLREVQAAFHAGEFKHALISVSLQLAFEQLKKRGIIS